MKKVAWRNRFLSGLKVGVRECGRRLAFLDERDSKGRRHPDRARGMGLVEFCLDREQGGCQALNRQDRHLLGC